jgi:hypothetical protein
MNSTSAAGMNRMTFLMSISEITPQLFLSGTYPIFSCFECMNMCALGQMAATIEQVQKLGITYIVVSVYL